MAKRGSRLLSWLGKDSKVAMQSNNETAAIYEAEKRKRTFKESWKEGRPWLIVEMDGDAQRMACSYCRIYPEHVGSNCAFVRGTKLLKLCEVKHHESLDGHRFESS